MHPAWDVRSKAPVERLSPVWLPLTLTLSPQAGRGNPGGASVLCFVLDPRVRHRVSSLLLAVCCLRYRGRDVVDATHPGLRQRIGKSVVAFGALRWIRRPPR